MMELFPTFWSPTRTILNFWMELRLDEKLMLSLILQYKLSDDQNQPITYNKIIMSQNPKANTNVNQFNRYLNNNIETLKQKFNDFYLNSFPLQDLTQQSHIEQSLKYIYDIFNFSKYQANQELNKTLRSSLIQNITTFQGLQPKNISFDPEMAIQLLRYCIQHNDMFAVHYDKKKNNPPPAEQNQPEKEQKLQPSPEQKPQQPSSPTPPQSPKKQQIVQEKPPEQMPSSPSNEFQGPPPSSSKQQNTQLIKKQLKDVFEFYCKQQQGVNPKSTFDNINHKCKTMNLGKFMTFAMASNIVYSRQKIYSQAKLDKGQIVSAFKRASKGNRQIQFNVFLDILNQLKQADPTIFQKMGLGQDGPKGKKKVIQNLKSIILPFNTKDREGRQVSPFGRVFMPKLTTHSGYHQQSLRDELSSRKLQVTQKHQGTRFDSKMMMNHPKLSEQIKNDDQIRYSLKLGESRNQVDSDINFLSKLITQEDNDQIFLKDYQLPKNKLKSQNITTESNRYRQDTGKQSSFSQNLGGFTARAKKAESFVLPSITKRGGQTEVASVRKSLGRPPRKAGPRVLLN